MSKRKDEKKKQEAWLNSLQTSLLSTFLKLSGLDGSTGVIAAALPYNMGGAPRDPGIFDSLDEKDQEIVRQSDAYYLTDRNGRRIVASTKERRCIFALAYYLSRHQKDKAFQEYVTKLDAGEQPQPLQFEVDMKELSKLLYKGRSRPTQLRELSKTINTLDSKFNVYEVYTKDNKKITYKGRIIGIVDSLKVEDLSAPQKDEESVIYHKLNLHFGKVFFWRLNKRFSILNPKYFEVTGTKGSGAETNIFEVIHDTLLSNFWHHITAYKTQRKQFQDELKSKGQWLSKEDFEKEVERRTANVLVHKERRDDILARLDKEDYKKNRRGNRFIIDVERAVKVLRDDLEFITDFKWVEMASDVWLYFTYNPNYMKKVLPEVIETKELDSKSE